MKHLWNKLESHLSKIDGAVEALRPGASDADIRSVEEAVGVECPDDFKDLYKVHNGQERSLFVFGPYRLTPLDEIAHNYRVFHGGAAREERNTAGAARPVKRCISGPRWLPFADHGDSSTVALDLDPDVLGSYGQVFEASEDRAQRLARDVREWFSNIIQDIEAGNLIWDRGAGGFREPPSRSHRQRMRREEAVRKRVEQAEKVADLENAEEGDVITLVGLIKPNHHKKKHRFKAKTFCITVEGEIGEIGSGMGGLPLVRLHLKVGKPRLFEFLGPRYQILACERIEDGV